jgi:trigger factor
MNIVKENTDALNAVIKVHVTPEDYNEKVETILKDYRRKANIPGFRPGKVPFGMIKKIYYKPVLADELNKLVIDSVFKYIYEEKLEILGEPLPAEKEEDPIDFDNDTEFNFAFDIGLSPVFELKISTKDKIPYYSIKVDEETITKHIENIRQRYGSFKTVDDVTENAYLKGILKQVGPNNEPLEDGLQNEESSLAVKIIKDEKIKKEFIGKKKGDKMVFDLKKAFPNDTEIAGLLRIDKDVAKDISGNFEFEILEISDFEKAQLDQSLFDKVYGEGNVRSEEEFKNKVIEEIKGAYALDSDYKFKLDAKDHFIDKFKLELPAEFLKRWLVRINKDKYTAEDIDKDFDKFEKDLHWQLISSRIVKENGIKVEEEETKAQAKKYALMQYQQYGIPNVPDEMLENFAGQILQNEDEKRKISDMVLDQKVFNYLKESVKLDEKEISLEKFNKLFEELKK